MLNKILMVSTITLFSFNSFAQDYLQCDLKIPDNKVKCPLIGKCPQKELRSSSTKLNIQLSDGITQTGEVVLNKIIVSPGTKKEEKNDIVLFSDDKRYEKFQDDLDLVDYEIGERISYQADKFGNRINLSLNSSVYTSNYYIIGNARLEGYVLTSESAISFTCKTVSEEIYKEESRKKKAIEEFNQRKEEKEKARAQEA